MMRRLLPLILCAGLTACASTAPYHAAQLKGEVYYLERIALPPAKTRVEVRLLDVNGPAPAVLAETLIEQPAGVPIPFTLRYDARTSGNLRLDAKLWVDNQLMMATPEPQPLALPATEPVRVRVSTVRGG